MVNAFQYAHCYSVNICDCQDIVENPQLIVEGHSRFDVKQGALGDWLVRREGGIVCFGRGSFPNYHWIEKHPNFVVLLKHKIS